METSLKDIYTYIYVYMHIYVFLLNHFTVYLKLTQY